jgi:hypothetical protein
MRLLPYAVPHLYGGNVCVGAYLWRECEEAVEDRGGILHPRSTNGGHVGRKIRSEKLSRSSECVAIELLRFTWIAVKMIQAGAFETVGDDG